MDARPTPLTDAVLASKVRPEDDHLTVRALQLRDLCRQLERSNAELGQALAAMRSHHAGGVMDARPTPRVDSLVNAKNVYSSLGEVLSWYGDAVHLARQLERSNAELGELLQAMVKAVVIPGVPVTGGLRNPSPSQDGPTVERAITALRNAGIET